jgi:hypothetical protein
MCFPVDFLDMIGRNSQDMTPARAARLQNPATIAGLHPLAETMNTFTAANFGLPSTLG